MSTLCGNRANAPPCLGSNPTWRRTGFRLIAVLLSLACVPPLCHSQTTPATTKTESQRADTRETAGPLLYRMIFAELDKIHELAKGEYRPIKRNEFDNRIRALRSQMPAQLVSGASISRAIYTGRLEGPGVLSGTASWQINALSSDGNTQAWCNLGRINLALTDLRWLNEQGDVEDAQLGLQPDGMCHLRVPRSATLQSHWTVPPALTGDGAQAFDLQLPAATLSRVDLQLPIDLELTCDHGVARRINLAADPAAVESGFDTSPAVANWQVELGGRTRCRLILRRRGSTATEFNLRQLTRYVLNEHGLELAADLYLDCDTAELSHLELSLDSALKLTAVTYDNKALPWTVSADELGANRVRILFPAPIRGLNRLVRVTAVAHAPEGNDLVLPRVRVPRAKWQQEGLQLRIASPFELQDFQLVQAVQMPLGMRDDNGVSMAIAVQCQSPDYEARLSVLTREAKCEAKSACQIEMGSNELRAVLNLDVRSRTKNNFQIQAIIADAWNLDLETIEAETPELIDEWQVLDSPTTPGRQLLQIRFAQALPTESWTQLSLRARRTIDVARDHLRVSELQPLRLLNVAESTRHFMFIQGAPSTEVVYPSDGQMTWLSIDDLDGNRETRLLGTSTPDRLIQLDVVTLAQPIAFRERSDEAAELSATIEINHNCGVRTSTEQFRIEVERVRGRLNKLHVRLSNARPEEVRWFLEAPLQRELPAKRVVRSAEEIGELWEIDWPELSDDTLVLIGERSWATQSTERVSLLRVLGATKSEGTLMLEGPATLRLNRQTPLYLTPLPVSQQTDEREINAQRMAFRYTPLADIFSPEHEIVLTFAEDLASMPPLTVWRLSDLTQLEPNGSTRHDVSLWLENPGIAHITARIPAACPLRHVFVNGTELTTPTVESGQIQIPLPLGDRYPCVHLQYDEPMARLRAWQAVSWRPLEVDASIVSRQWHVWVPTDLALAPPSLPGLNERLQRLLGPFQRMPSERPFHLFSSDDWSAALGGTWAPTSWTSMTQAVVTRLGTADARNLSQALSAGDGTAIWIDPRPIAELGIGPQSPLPDSLALGDYERGLDRLERLGLACIAADDGVLLTSSDALSSHWQSEPSHESPWLQRLPGYHFAERHLVNRQGLPIGSPLIALRQWHRTHFPWQTKVPENSPNLAAGWRVSNFDLARTRTITVFRRTWFWIVAYAAFISAATVSFCLKRHDVRRCVLLLLVGVALLLVASGPWIAIGQAALWGGFCGLLCPRLARPQPKVMPRLSTVTRSVWTTTSLLIGLSFWNGMSAWELGTVMGQESPNLLLPRSQISPDAETEILEVFVPSDAAGDPNTDYLLIPLALQRYLYASNGIELEAEPPWLLAKTTYTGAFEPVEGRAQLQLNSITADFELMVTRAGNAIRFPLAPAAAQALRREALLDGRPVLMQWEADRSAIRLPIRQTGRHHLQLGFQTVAIAEEGRMRLSLPIPAALQAELVLTSPQDLQSIDAPGASGPIQRREASGQLRADLGPINELVITWPAPVTANSTPVVDQLNWLRLSRDGVRLETQFLVDTRRYVEPTLMIEADERLQLDYPVSNQPLALSPGSLAGLRRLEFDLSETIGGKAIIQLSFNVTGSTGIGQNQFPHLTVLGAATRNYLAVTSASNLIVRIDPGNGSSMPTSEFARRWGGTNAPDFAYQFGDRIGMWQCEGQWLRPPLTADVAAHYVVGPTSTQVVWLASLRADQRSIFQQRMLTPAGFELESATLLQSGMSLPLRWSRGNDKQITLFFDEPPTGTFQVGLVGTQTDRPNETRTLPRIRFLEAVQRLSSLDVYRQSSVLATFDWPSQSAAVNVPAWIRNQVGNAIWLGRSETPSDDAEWPVLVTTNERRVRAEMINVVSRNQGAWVHRLYVHVEMDEGILDSLTFEIPEEWKAWLQDNSDLRLTYTQASRPQMVRVTIAPLRAPLDLPFPDLLIPITAGQPLSIPNIRLLEAGQIERFLFLPSSIEGQAVQWRPTGLERLVNTEPPAELRTAGTEYDAYRIAGDSFQATRLPTKIAIGQPRVNLADIHMACMADGTQHGLALLSLNPDGLDECLLQVPTELAVGLIAVENRPIPLNRMVTAENANSVTYVVPLASNELPQRVRVLYSQTQPTPDTGVTDASQLTLLAPKLAFQSSEVQQPQLLEVDQTLWTLYDLSTNQLRPSLPAQSDLAVELLRLSSLTRAGERANQLATDFSTADLRRWYSVWGPRIVTSLHRYRTLSTDDELDANGADAQYEGAQETPAKTTTGSEDQSAQAAEAATTLRQLHSQQLDLAASLQVDDLFQRLFSENLVTDALSVWLAALPTAQPSWSVQIDGEQSELVVNIRAPRPRQWAIWLSAVLCAATGVGWQFWPRFKWPASPRWPALTGVLVGLTWWLWLEPSGLGWLVVVLSLLVLRLVR